MVSADSSRLVLIVFDVSVKGLNTRPHSVDCLPKATVTHKCHGVGNIQLGFLDHEFANKSGVWRSVAGNGHFVGMRPVFLFTIGMGEAVGH